MGIQAGDLRHKELCVSEPDAVVSFAVRRQEVVAASHECEVGQVDSSRGASTRQTLESRREACE